MSFGTWLKSPVNHRGQILDLSVFLVNLFLLAPFINLLQRLGQGFSANDNAASQQLALIILAAFVVYTLGAILKRPALHERRTIPSPDYAGCLYVAWVSLHLTLCILGAALIAASFNQLPRALPVLAMIMLSTLPTIFATRLVFRPKKLATMPLWRRHWVTELSADMLIVAAVILLTIIWSIWVSGLFFVNWPSHTFGDKLLFAALAAGAFALFYVTPRFMFLIEDFNRWPTWATIALTLAPLVIRILFGSAPAE